jgi:hypothetical protein
MPIQPFLPIALLNSAERVFQLAKRSSVEAGQRLLEEGANLDAQRLGLGRQMERRELELGDRHCLLGGWTPPFSVG